MTTPGFEAYLALGIYCGIAIFLIAVLLLLYVVITGRSSYIAGMAKDTYSRLLAGSLAYTFFVYVVVNSGMVSGVLPVVGVPLPLISYGGSSLLVTCLALALLLRVAYEGESPEFGRHLDDAGVRYPAEVRA